MQKKTKELELQIKKLEKEKNILIELICNGWKSPTSKTGYAVGWEIAKETLLAHIDTYLKTTMENEK